MFKKNLLETFPSNLLERHWGEYGGENKRRKCFLVGV